MSAPITDMDREIARRAVSLTLELQEAAWEPVAQLIADYTIALRALGTADVLRSKLDKADKIPP